MNEKKYSVVKRYWFYNILSWLGVIVAVVGYFLSGALKQILPWVGLLMVIGAIVFRFTMVRCPHCGNLLTESKTIPDKCPKCGEELK